MDKLTMAAVRKNAGLTQEQMAQKLGMSGGTYSRYENKPYTMQVGAALRFLKIVGAEIGEVDFCTDDE